MYSNLLADIQDTWPVYTICFVGVY